MTPVDAFYLYTEAAGLVMQAEKEGPGSKLLLQYKHATADPAAATQLFTLRDGVLTNIGDDLVVDYRDGAVMLWTPVSGSATQQWVIDDQGKVTSPGVPGLVMRATRSNPQANFYYPGAQVVMATDTPYYPNEGEWFRRWPRLWTSARRSVFSLAGSVLGTTPDRPAVSDGSAGQLWFPSQGMFVNDGSTGAVLWARDLGGGRDYRVPILNPPNGPYGASLFEVHEAEQRIANPSSGTYLDYLPNATIDGTNEFRQAGQGGDYRWCFGNGEQWAWEPGDLIDLSVGSDGFVAGVSKDNTVVYYTGAGRWQPMPGGLTGIVDVAVGSRTVIWVMDAVGTVRRFTNAAPSYWTTVPGPAMTSISVALTGTAWAVDHNASILRYSVAQGGWQVVTPDWQRTRGHIDQISTTSEQDVWATGKDGQIWWFDPDLNVWESVPGTLERVSTGADGSAWGVDSKSLTYRYVGDDTEDWHQEPTLFSRISVGAANFIWALGPGGVYRYAPHPSAPGPETKPRAGHGRAHAQKGGQPHVQGDPAPPPTYAPTASDVQEAIFCANMASASYGTDAEVRAKLAEFGFTPFRFFHNLSTGTDGFLAYNDALHQVVLAFRGTSSMQDANIDLWQEMGTVDFLGPEVKVVQGFDYAYTSVENEVMAAVRELMTPGPTGRLATTATFYVTGHSLGGGLATIAALQLAQLLKQQGRSGFLKAITFAAPAVGNPDFRKYYLSQTRLFASIAYVSQNDSVATGEWWVAPGVVLDLKDWGYVSPVPSIYYFDDDLGMPECHVMANYFQQLDKLAERVSPAIESIVVEVTTGDLSVAPWWWFDSPGTSREVTVTVGRTMTDRTGRGGRVNQVLRPAANDWNWERMGSGFESGQRTSFTLNNVRGLTQEDLQWLQLSIDVSGNYIVDADDWFLAGVKVTANGVVRYDNQHVNVSLGPSFEWAWSDDIPPLP